MASQGKWKIGHVIPFLQIFISSVCCTNAFINGQFNSTNSMNRTESIAFWNEINKMTTTQRISHLDEKQADNLLSSPVRVENGRISTSDPFHEMFSKYFDGSGHCKKMQSCKESNGFSETFPKKSCYCDSLCNILDDCCENFSPVIKLPFKKQQFSCIMYNGPNNVNGYGIYMITSCLDHWKHENIRSLCENPGNNILLKTPVTDKSLNKVTYRNMYCAQCNFVYNFEYWRTNITCSDNKTDIPGCTIRQTPISSSMRFCKTKVKSNCSNVTNVSLSNECTNGPFSLVYTHGKAYRNIYCAQCDGYRKDELFCSELKSSIPTAQPSLYSFRLLVDLNNGVGSKLCKDDEIYDTFSRTCRQIYCTLPSIPIKGVCVVDSKYDTTLTNMNLTINTNCTLVKVNSKEYKTLNDSTVLLLFNQAVLNNDKFRIIGTDMYVCRDMIARCNSDCDDGYWFTNSTLGKYMTVIGLSVSIMFLVITFMIYICTPQLLNLHGKNLVCLVVTLLLGHVLYLLSPQAESIPILCKCLAVLLHFLYLSSFCWMNVIAFEFCSTFSQGFTLVERNRNLKRYILYSIYAWCTPLVIVLVSLSFDFAELSSNMSSFKPGYGKGICWIMSSRALLLFLAIPFTLFKLFDFVAFTLTMIFISRGRRQGSKASKKNSTCTCIINLKISVIMGFTWVFAFIANISKSMTVWYIYIAFNSLQGMFIAICFLCSKSVLRKIKAKFKTSTATYTNSVT